MGPLEGVIVQVDGRPEVLAWSSAKSRLRTRALSATPRRREGEEEEEKDQVIFVIMLIAFRIGYKEGDKWYSKSSILAVVFSLVLTLTSRAYSSAE